MRSGSGVRMRSASARRSRNSPRRSASATRRTTSLKLKYKATSQQATLDEARSIATSALGVRWMSLPPHAHDLLVLATLARPLRQSGSQLALRLEGLDSADRHNQEEDHFPTGHPHLRMDPIPVVDLDLDRLTPHLLQPQRTDPTLDDLDLRRPVGVTAGMTTAVQRRFARALAPPCAVLHRVNSQADLTLGQHPMATIVVTTSLMDRAETTAATTVDRLVNARRKEVISVETPVVTPVVMAELRCRSASGLGSLPLGR